jgi:hypothetical protein
MPWLIGIMTFLLISTAAAQMSGGTTCSDGWRSGSIGSQGACSHHGGVDRAPISFLIALAAGVGVGLGYSALRRRRTRTSEEVSFGQLRRWREIERPPAPARLPPDTAAATAGNVPRCAECGSDIIAVIDHVGPHKGVLRRRCSNRVCPGLAE